MWPSRVWIRPAGNRVDRPEDASADIFLDPCGPIVGDLVGFSLTWEGQEHGSLWISGDTGLYEGIRQVADRLSIGTALLRLGDVRFPITGPVHYTMTAREAVELCQPMAQTAIPIHYDGWKHFKQSRAAIEREFARAP